MLSSLRVAIWAFNRPFVTFSNWSHLSVGCAEIMLVSRSKPFPSIKPPVLYLYV